SRPTTAHDRARAKRIIYTPPRTGNLRPEILSRNRLGTYRRARRGPEYTTSVVFSNELRHGRPESVTRHARRDRPRAFSTVGSVRRPPARGRRGPPSALRDRPPRPGFRAPAGRGAVVGSSVRGRPAAKRQPMGADARRAGVRRADAGLRRGVRHADRHVRLP